MTLRVVFAGTPEFAVPCLRALLAADIEVVAVLTQPDRPAGRGRQLQPSPVKQLAQSAGVPVWQPESLRGLEIQDRLRTLQADLMVVVAYGLILPKRVLDIPRWGCWNVHASLLPRWRGAAPIQRAVEAGDTHSGVCLMQMEKGLDTGPVLLRRAIELAPHETSASLHDRLAVLGAELLAEGIGLLSSGRLPAAEPQPELGVSYAHKLDKAEARLDWTRTATALERSIRAMLPWPVAELEFGGEVLRVHAAEAIAGEGRPGERLASPRGQLVVACGEGALRLLRVQRAGGRVMDAADYLNASQPQVKRERKSGP